MELVKAKKLLEGGKYTCVLCCGDEFYTSTLRGVAPLLAWLDSNELPKHFSAADKAVGKAPACIYVLLGAKAVYANIMTTPAIGIFDRYGIKHECAIEVPMIRNRTDTDFCPVELAVKDCTELWDVVEAARKCLSEMNKK